MVAQLAREVEVLLHQNHRDPPEIAQVDDGAADILDDRGLNALGRLVQQQQARPMASCCCCPPERSPSRRPSMSLSTGNSANTSSGIERSSRLSGAKPVLRFSYPRSPARLLLAQERARPRSRVENGRR